MPINDDLKMTLEMKKFRTKKLDSDVWIPLFSSLDEQQGEYFTPGSNRRDYCVRSILVPRSSFNVVTKLEWNDLGPYDEASSWIDSDGQYVLCDEGRDFVRKEEKDVTDDDWYIPIPSTHPILIQRFGYGPNDVWHLHQDIVIALKLLRQGDSWVRPSENNVEVARLNRDSDGIAYSLEIKNEFLKDYLCARDMGLYVATYRCQQYIFEEDPQLGWGLDCVNDVPLENGKWRGSVYRLTENGHTPGTKVSILNAKRTDIDAEDDVPVMNFPDSDGCVETSTEEFVIQGERIVYDVRGEIWKNELIEPGYESIRIRGDEPQDAPKFKVDASGKTLTSKELMDEGRWLWFNADVANALAKTSEPILNWYTLETGCIGSCGYSVHFGINEKGLINVYAKDIAMLPIWLQRIWAGFNVSPESGVSKELLMSQVEVAPARTQAPEYFLPIEYNRLNETFARKFGDSLFNISPDVESLLAKINRFESTSDEGFLKLAKDLAKIFVDSVNCENLKKIVTIPKGQQWGSLKLVQNLLVQKSSFDEDECKQMMCVLFGIYDLRNSDAHIKGPSIEEALLKIKIKSDAIPLFKGTALLIQFLNTLIQLNNVIAGIDNDLH